jgi:dsRNA-specific ribonuclease
LGHRELAVQVLTPPCVCGDHRCNYERLEFLGDALLKMACTVQHYRQHPLSDEV